MEIKLPRLAMNDVAYMRETVFYEGPRFRERVSRFWILLVLASVIAAAGVASDSTATVIGAMIIAPLMVPIQGTMLATVLGDPTNLSRSIGLMLAGAAAAVGIAVLVGLLLPVDVVAENNSQVAARVHPRLIDLLAALGTGVVGSIALVRRDISDALPGVAIAISLVPPLSVVGFTLEAGALLQSIGALLLFMTNVAAILGTGIVVMALYGVNRLGEAPATQRGRRTHRRNAILVAAAMAVIVLVPLSVSSVSVTRSSLFEASVQSVSERWATDAGWRLEHVTTAPDNTVVVSVEGPLPLPDTTLLEQALRSGGLNPRQVRVVLVPAYTVDY
ncbi:MULTISPECIES: DUF389 domain-containing protein [Cryobacterium]|uniref:DUF389 domain-containing protein n=1 Tax=Cryobacterium breve TaxID=1259258 RepID=A0ABY2JBU1_9MICO|nr:MULTISPECIES: DUF389 domain-containing protein [Cryobacterium]TFC91158.1 DUF389 domain-containing protein [Cryobacterium sp. TmT3-12]TFD01147.1 DUF389 domain-containing protein [Cryobacterium breve]